jgi:hypothetical protein
VALQLKKRRNKQDENPIRKKIGRNKQNILRKKER